LNRRGHKGTREEGETSGQEKERNARRKFIHPAPSLLSLEDQRIASCDRWEPRFHEIREEKGKEALGLKEKK